MFDWKPNLVLIVPSTVQSGYSDWAILSMIDVDSTYKNNKVIIPYTFGNYDYASTITLSFFVKYLSSKLYWYYSGNWEREIGCNTAEKLYYYIAFP